MTEITLERDDDKVEVPVMLIRAIGVRSEEHTSELQSH